MKKLYLLLLVSLLTTVVLQAQQLPYYDALTLRKMLNENTKTWPDDDEVKDSVAKILTKYSNGGNIQVIFLTNNHFISPLAGFSAFSATPNFADLAKGIITGLGSSDETVLIDGIARFLVKRVKEELSIAFFSRLQALLQKPEFADARTLFPQTTATLNLIGDQIYNYNIYLSNLRDAFGNDLDDLLQHLPDVVNNPNYATFFHTHAELKALLLSAIYLGDQLQQQQPAGKILENYNTELLDSLPNKDIKGAVQTLQLVSASLRSQGTDHYWIDKDSIQLLIKDPVAVQIYLGLIYQQAINKNIQFNAGSLATIMDSKSVPENIVAYNKYIQGFISNVDRLITSINDFKDKPADKRVLKDYYPVYDNTFRVFEYATKVKDLPGMSITISPSFINYISLMRAGGNVARDLGAGEYGSALINICQLYQYGIAAYNENKVPKQTDPGKVSRFLLQYGATIASLAAADSSAEVEAILEKAVLPPGSATIKRVSLFNVSLNAYTGLYGGHEFIKGVNDKLVVNSFGVTAPIGFSFSWGHKLFFFNSKHEWSTSLFVSLVDLGAVAAYRFGDDSTASVPTIQFKNIVSPGVFLSIGIPKTPLSVNLGGQMGPNLRKIDQKSDGLLSNDYENKVYWRVSAGIVVDIPLLNLYTK